MGVGLIDDISVFTQRDHLFFFLPRFLPDSPFIPSKNGWKNQTLIVWQSTTLLEGLVLFPLDAYTMQEGHLPNEGRKKQVLQLTISGRWLATI